MATVDPVVIAAAAKHVVSGAAEERIAFGATVKAVSTLSAVDQIRARAGPDAIVSCTAPTWSRSPPHPHLNWSPGFVSILSLPPRPHTKSGFIVPLSRSEPRLPSTGTRL